MAERNANLWAPWRMEYVENIPAGGSGCFLCDYAARPADDGANLVVRRTDDLLVLLNRFPYASGHVLIAPAAHLARPQDCPPSLWAALCEAVRVTQLILGVAFRAEGFNIGMNLGRAAGAGLPGHLHWHIVPRWPGDTNFMPVFADVKVMPESLERVAEKFRAAAAELKL